MNSWWCVNVYERVKCALLKNFRWDWVLSHKIYDFLENDKTFAHYSILKEKYTPFMTSGSDPFHFPPNYGENIFQFFVSSVWKGKYCQQFVVSATSSIPYLVGCPFSTSCLKNHKLTCVGES